MLLGRVLFDCFPDSPYVVRQGNVRLFPDSPYVVRQCTVRLFP